MFDCFGVRFEKKPNFQNGQKRRENRTNMDIILLVLAKPVGKHGITLVHITHPPLVSKRCKLGRLNFETTCQNNKRNQICAKPHKYWAIPKEMMLASKTQFR